MVTTVQNEWEAQPQSRHYNLAMWTFNIQHIFIHWIFTQLYVLPHFNAYVYSTYLQDKPGSSRSAAAHQVYQPHQLFLIRKSRSRRPKSHSRWPDPTTTVAKCRWQKRDPSAISMEEPPATSVMIESRKYVSVYTAAGERDKSKCGAIERLTVGY